MTQDVHTLVGAYALDALSDAERRQFQHHLDECETCTQELRGLRETTARLAGAVLRSPPAGLRERVLAETARVRQQPPALESARSIRRRIFPQVMAVAAAACLLLAVVLGITTVRTNQRAGHAEALNREIAGVLAAPDARTANAPVRAGGMGAVVSSRGQGKAVVVMSGLAALPSSKTYELWLMGPSSPRPIGLMRAADGPVITGELGDADQVGLTIEPAKGSPAPTGAPIFAVRLPA
jgi:anti-sigma-K factor RskA